MPRFDERTIEKVKDANDIVDVVGQHVRLTKKGSCYFGLCPFHGEKTPSFCVSPGKQIFHCFGCGTGGNVITFLMKYENYSYREAVKELAVRAHISLPEYAQNDNGQSGSGIKEKLFGINKEAALFYVDKLYSQDGKPGLRYFLEERGLSKSVLRHFGLGYAPKTRNGLYTYMKGKGYDDAILKESGLFTYSGSSVSDKFFNRVMFPIMDTNNRVRGFGGRVLGDAQPKYLNSPETPVFDKSELLYGLNFAKKSRSKYLLLSEGYMDVIALHQAGFTNSVASLGTAFNERHARVLKRYTGNVILAQDSDEAGTRAKLKAYPILKEAGLNVKVMELKGAKDPDEYIRAYGPSAYEDCIKEAENGFMFIVRKMKEEYDLGDPAGRTDFYNALSERLLMFGEPLERANYIDSISREYMVDKNLLENLVAEKARKAGYSRKYQDEGGAAYRKTGATSGRKNVPACEKIIIAWLLELPGLSPYVFKYITPEMFSCPVLRDMASSFYQGVKINASDYMLKYQEDEEASGIIAEAAAENSRISDVHAYSRQDLEKGLTEAVRTLKAAYIENQLGSGDLSLQLMDGLLKEKNRLTGLYVKLDEEIIKEA